jgi:hypothetical protein
MVLNGGRDMKKDRVVFSERNAAAQSMRSGWTRMASTYGCINVALTEDSLWIKPHWFADWMIRLLRLDLHHEIPIGKISVVKAKGKWFGYGIVEIGFTAGDSKTAALLLYLKKEKEFIQKVNELTAE